MKQSKKIGMIKALSLLSILLALFGMAAMVSANSFPSMPNQFYGTVTINSADAPVGTTITAYIDGESRGSVVTTTTGEYGDDLNYLDVAGNDSDVITFRVGGVLANENITWCGGCGPRRLDLSATAELCGDTNGDGVVDMDELVAAVDAYMVDYDMDALFCVIDAYIATAPVAPA